MEDIYNNQTDIFVEEMILGNDNQAEESVLIEKEEKDKSAYKKIPVSEPSKVYVKKDSQGKIIEISSEYFIDDFAGWEYLTEGFGDKFAHPQIKDFM